LKKELVAILGAGESGVGAALLAQAKGFEVLVSEYGTIKEKYKKELTDNKIPFEEEGHSFDIIKTAKWIVKSPGIPDKADIIVRLKAEKKSVISEIEFASMFYNGKIIAITGSNGKTTTTSLVHHLLDHAKLNVGVAGNIGVSFSRVVAVEPSIETVVLELSSFQLDNIDQFRPDIAVILNITADHLDRYEYEVKNYAASKWRICKNQNADDQLILNADDKWIIALNNQVGTRSEMIWLSANDPIKVLASKEVKHNLKGAHNDYNVSVAISIAKLMNVDTEIILNGLLSFKAIAHRLETIAFINGVEYINDSKATNVDAVYYALEAMKQPVVWIAGGTDKGNDYDEIRSLVKQKVKTLICMGLDNSKLVDAFQTDLSAIVSTHDITAAVKAAFEHAERGDVVLLSPACASFDLFKNYEDRGALFKERVLKLLD